MEKTIESISKNKPTFFSKKNVGIVASVVAVAILATGYYGGFFDRFTKAALTTWTFDDAADYTTTSRITIADGFASVDLDFTPAFDFDLSPYTNFTDLWSNPTGLIVSAINSDSEVAYSFNNGSDWNIFNLNNDIRVKRIADSGVLNNIYGLGSTTASGSRPGHAAVVYANVGIDDITELNYIYLPNAGEPGEIDPNLDVDAFTAGIVHMDRLYAGMSVKSPDMNSIAVVSTANYLEQPIYFNTLPYVKQVNDLYSVAPDANILYATVSMSPSTPPVSLAANLWYTDDGGVSWQGATLSMDDPSTDHSATLGIISDGSGYIYVTTNEDYILKSTVPYGTEFEKLYVNVASNSMGIIKTDSRNNIWAPLRDGSWLRAVDGNGTGADDFFVTNSGMDIGDASSVWLQDLVILGNGQYLIAGGYYQSGAPYKGVVWLTDVSSDQYFITNDGLDFYELNSFIVTKPNTASIAKEFTYRISHVSNDGPWYYYDTDAGSWVEAAPQGQTSYSLELANTADVVNTFASSYDNDLGVYNGVFYLQAIYTQEETDHLNYDIIIDEIALDYVDAVIPHLELVLDSEHYEINKPFSFTVTAYDQNDQVIENFDEDNLVGGPTLIVMSNMTGEISDDGHLQNCVAGPWTSGVIMYTGCTVDLADHSEKRFIGAGYYNEDLDEDIYGITGAWFVDVTALPLDNFVVRTIPPSTTVNTPFTIHLEAHVSDMFGSFIKTDFAETVNLVADANGDEIDDGTMNYNIIGDGTIGTWNEGIVFYDNYEITTANTYDIYAKYLDISARTSLRVNGPDAPDITELHPNSGYPGDQVDINGINFGIEEGFVTFGLNGASIVSWSDTFIVAVAPDGVPGSQVYVGVQTTTSGSTLPNDPEAIWTYNDSINPPTISNIVDDFGPDVGGKEVTIFGDNFTWPPEVVFGDAQVDISDITIDDSQTMIVVTPPHAPGFVDVTVINPDDQQAVLINGFEYIDTSGDPAITNLNPNSGAASGGTLVDISGTNLGDVMGTVKFTSGSTDEYANITLWTNTLVRILTPSSASGIVADVSVITDGGFETNTLSYTYTSVTAPKSVTYYSPEFDVTEMVRLEDISIIADGYSQSFDGEERVAIAIGLFDESGFPVMPGNDGLGTGYTIIPSTPLGQAVTLINLSQDPGFINARSIKFRIFMYDPSFGDNLNEQPWVESITLDYTLAKGSIGQVAWHLDEIKQKNVIEGDTVVTYNMAGVSEFFMQFSEPSYDVELGILWNDPSTTDDDPTDITVEFLQNDVVNNVLSQLGPSIPQIPFTLRLTYTGSVFDDTEHQFVVTGIGTPNNLVYLIDSEIGSIILGSGQPAGDFQIQIEDSTLVTAPDGTLEYDISIVAVDGFDGEVTLDTNLDLFPFDIDYLQSGFNPNPVPAGSSSVLTVKVVADPSNVDQWIDFEITGTADALEHTVTASLYIFTGDIEDFILIVREPVNKTAQTNSQVVYIIDVIYHPEFTDDITLATDIETIFTDVTAVFDSDIIINGDASAQLIVDVGENPTPLDVDTTFIITGTSNAIVHDATPSPSLTILSPTQDDVTLNISAILDEYIENQLEYCVDPATDEDTCDAWASAFKLNLYEEGATDPEAHVVSRVDLEATIDEALFPRQGLIDGTPVTIVAAINKDILTDGVTYTPYLRSPRHLWTISNDTFTYVEAQLDQSYDISFDELVFADVDENNVINGADLLIAMGAWGAEVHQSLVDAENNDVINASDFLIFMDRWGLIGHELFLD